MDLKTLLRDNVVHFLYYRKGYLYYQITEPVEEPIGYSPQDGPLPHISWMFPVPIDDTGDATFAKTEKAIHLMRYVRKAQAEGSFVRYHA